MTFIVLLWASRGLYKGNAQEAHLVLYRGRGRTFDISGLNLRQSFVGVAQASGFLGTAEHHSMPAC